MTETGITKVRAQSMLNMLEECEDNSMLVDWYDTYEGTLLTMINFFIKNGVDYDVWIHKNRK